MKRSRVVGGIAAAAALAFFGFRLLTTRPDAEEAARLHRKAIDLQGRGQTEGAEAAFRAAVACDPESIPINRDYQNLMRKAGRLEIVREEYRRRAAHLPRNAAARYLAARLEEGEAFETGMRASLAADPDFIWAHRALGLHLAAAGRPEEAVPHLRRAAGHPDAERDDVGTLLHLLFRSGRPSEMDPLVERLMKRRPGFADREARLVTFALGALPSGLLVELQVSLDRAAVPHDFNIRFVRADGAERWMTARGETDDFRLEWSREWIPSGGSSRDAPVETIPVQGPPRFSAALTLSLSRLSDDEKQ